MRILPERKFNVTLVWPMNVVGVTLKADYFHNVSLSSKFIPVFALDDGAHDRVSLSLEAMRRSPRIAGYLDIR